MLAKIAQIMAGVILAGVILGALALGTLAVVHQGQASVVACHDVNTLRTAIVSVLQNGEKALPHSQYYKAHPDQLRAALQTYADDIAKLGPVAC